MSNNGAVFNIQKYSLNDGDGIRTIVFLKGCPMRCIWCANPESQEIKSQLMFGAAKCIGCKRCEISCSNSARALGQWDSKRCTLCGRCASACPSEAIEMVGKIMTISDIIKEVEKDRNFYESSGGGVTLSGGEPLLQWQFASNLVSELKRKLLHVAIETTGYAPWEHVHSVVKDCDLVLYDIKHMNSDAHKHNVGVPNERILDNAKRLAAFNFNMIFRVPLIGGINDNVENIADTADFARNLGLREIHLLPYHRFGEFKYKKLQMENICAAYTPDDEHVRMLKAVIQSKGLKVVIGG